MPSLHQGKALMNKKKKTTTEGFATDPYASSSSSSSSTQQAYQQTMKAMDESLQASSAASQSFSAAIDANTAAINSSSNSFATQWGQYNATQNQILQTAQTYSNATENDYFLGSNVGVYDVNGMKCYGYITMQGVLKLYQSEQEMTEIQFTNNCGNPNYGGGILEGNLPFSFESYIQNSQDYMYTVVTTTTPNVLIGSPMTIGMQCGLEGQNVYVSTQSNNPTALYYGAYADNPDTPAMEFLQNGDAVFTYQDCLNAAANTGSSMFALQGVNPSNPNQQLAQCALGNDSISASQYGAVVGSCSQGTDMNSYGSGNAISWYALRQGEYAGVFTDVAGAPAMTPVNGGVNSYDYNSCLQYAQTEGWTYFALEDAKSGGPNAKCNVAANYEEVSSYGFAAESDQEAISGHYYGKGYNNAAYFLPQQNPNIGCYNAVGPDGQPGKGWKQQPGGATWNYNSCAQTAVEQDAMYFGLGDLGPNGQEGTCYISNSEAELSQYGTPAATVVQADGATYGTPGVNALYEMNSGGNADLIGSVGRVDENGQLCPYSNNMYMVPATTSDGSGNDSSSTTTTSIIPQTPQPILTVDIPSCGGSQEAPVPIDSIAWGNYQRGSAMTSTTTCGLNTYIDNEEWQSNYQQDILASIYSSIGSTSASMATYLSGSSGAEGFVDSSYSSMEGFVDSSYSSMEGFVDSSSSEMLLAQMEGSDGIFGLLQENQSILQYAKNVNEDLVVAESELTAGLQNITGYSGITFVQQQTTFYLWSFIALLFFLFTAILFGKVVLLGEIESPATGGGLSMMMTGGKKGVVGEKRTSRRRF